MRVGQRPQLVPVVLRRLMVAGFAHFDREQIVGDLALVHDDVGIDRFCQMVVGRDDRAMRQPQGPLAQPVVVAIDLPSRKLRFQMHRQPMRQRAFAEVMLQEPGLVRVKFLKRRDDLVEFGLHLTSDKDILEPNRQCIELFSDTPSKFSKWLHSVIAGNPPHICTSISRGPFSGMASASAAPNSSAVVTARPGTPMPLASATKSSVGRSIFSMSWARWPGWPERPG